MSFSSSEGMAFASFSMVLYFLNSSGVTRFTLSSVHCALKITATANSCGVEKFKGQEIVPNSFFSSLWTFWGFASFKVEFRENPIELGFFHRGII